jgi:hypothetical protein
MTRIRCVLERHDLNPLALGLSPRPGDEASPDQHDSPEYTQPLLDFGEAQEGSFLPGLKAASIQSAVPFGPRAGQPLRRLLDPDLARAYAAAGWSGRSQRSAPPLVMNSQGFSLHAATLVAQGNRSQLEKLCRYVTRPAICLKRLEVRADGMISWKLRRPWRDGTRAFLMTPYEFIARLASLVPHPREHQLTYQGVLAPASPLRDYVIPRPPRRAEPANARTPDAAVIPEHAASEGDTDSSADSPLCRRYIPWANLLERVFLQDVLRCPNCGGRRHMISVVTDPASVGKVLEGVRLGAAKRASAARGRGGGVATAEEPSRAPPETSPPRIPMPPRQGRLDFGG